MDELSNWVQELLQKFPDPEDFIKEIEKTDKPDNEKGDYFFEIGSQLSNVSNFKLALKVRNKALEYYLKLNNKAGQAKCFKSIGTYYGNLGDLLKAIEYKNKALEISREIGDKQKVFACFISLGWTYLELDDFRRTIECCNKALETKGAEGNKVSEAFCWQLLGKTYCKLSDFRMAQEYTNKAVEIFKAIGNKEVYEAICYDELGYTYTLLGNFQKAIEFENKALEIFKAIGYKIGESGCYEALGIICYQVGDFSKAIEYYNKSLEISKVVGNKKLESGCYINLSEVYKYLRDFYKALEYEKMALRTKKAISDKTGVSICYGNLGHIYRELGDYCKAIEYENKAIEICRTIGNKKVESDCYADIGRVYLCLNDFQKAIEYENKALETSKAIGYKEGEADSYNNLGEVYECLGDFKRCIEYYKRALKIVDEIKVVYDKKNYLGNIGKVYFNKEDFREAENYYKQAVKILESLRKHNIPPEYKRKFWQDNIALFDNLIISDIKLEKKEEALEYSERGKGRTVFDFILGRGIEEKFKPEPLSFKEIQELAKRIEKNLVLFRVTEKGSYSFTLNPEGEFDLLGIPEFNIKRLEELTVKLEAGKPVGGWIHAYANYKSVNDKIRPLLLEEKVIEAGKILKEEEVKWFKTMDDTLKILYDELIGKVFSRFKKGEKVAIIPNRALNILPLHACFYEEPQSAKRRYLIEDFEISYAPNCNILDLCNKREAESGEERADRRKDSFFSIANPVPPYNLTFSEWEVEEISKLFDAKEVYIKEEVKDKLLDKIADYSVIHLSTHGIYDLSSSFSSKLFLGREVDLTLEEIFEKIRIDKSWLVSLSACESGLVDYRDIADEYIGLQTGFLYAGAPTVIASLWSVSDYSTALVMIKTYEYIFKENLSKTEALRKAQLWLKELTAGEALVILRSKELELEYSTKMTRENISPIRRAISLEDPKSKPFAHPYHWAGFQIFGA